MAKKKAKTKKEDMVKVTEGFISILVTTAVGAEINTLPISIRQHYLEKARELIIAMSKKREYSKNMPDIFINDALSHLGILYSKIAVAYLKQSFNEAQAVKDTPRIIL